ncbi:hypothetical protein [Verrucomicrobium sp. BvORR106]|uniref:hypothetical protein n=1 Tax=Verrucomicrobium sp. BvORR106 TaxID=1403819 RepID=UPI0005708605|nr:hypothetical protein [Verrucomicrobium sp. BvORR106]
MPRALAWILIAIASLRLAGGDLLVLQVAAWSGMIATRTAEQGLTEAVKTTFDGDHPCRLCSMVKEAAVAEEKAPTSTSSSSKSPVKSELAKLKEFVPMSPVAMPQAHEIASLPQAEWFNNFTAGRHDAPQLPPPQILA